MGSFDVSCGASSVPISFYDNAYLVLLIKAGYNLYRPDGIRLTKIHDDGLYHASHLIYSDCLFQPFALPVKGEYSTYGYLENIERNANTELLESFFGISVEDITRCVGTSTDYGSDRRKGCFDGCKTLPGKTKQRWEIVEQLSGMFVHEDIYEFLTSESLLQEPGIFKFQDTTLGQAYDLLKQQLVEFNSIPKPGPEASKEELLDYFRKTRDDPMNGESEKHTSNLAAYFRFKGFTFKALYRDIIRNGLLKKEICDFINFDYSLNLCNRIYFPTTAGAQHAYFDEAQPLRSLYQKSLEIIGKKIAQQKAENRAEFIKCKACNLKKEHYIDNFCKKCHLHYYDW